MLRESESIRVHGASKPKERLFRDRRTAAAPNKFGTVVRALWPDKPALNLAQRMGVNPATGKPYTERNALQIIRGERRVTARAIHVVNSEMLE